MAKKKVLIALSVAVALTMPLSVFAATSDTSTAKNIRGFFGFNASKLTDTQKKDVQDYRQKMADLQKDFINKMVANGSMTKEQGDAEIKRIDDMQKNGGESGFMPGFGMGRGGFDGHMKQGGFGKIDTSKLTDQQKADLKATAQKMVALQKDLITKMVSAGLMTKEQGDTATKKVDAMSASIENGDFAGCMMIGKAGFGVFGFKGGNTSKLTDEQKAIFTDFSTKMDALQKEMTSKLVADGLITQEQADKAAQMKDKMQNFMDGKAPQNGKIMRKGHFGGQGQGGKMIPGTNSSASTQTES